MKRDVVGVNHPIVQKKINRSLNLSIKEGVMSSISTNLSLSYFTPAALAMSATNVQMGILYAILSLVPGVIQIKSASLIEKFSRKKLVLSGVIGKIVLIFPFLLIGFLHWMGVPHMMWIFIGLIGLHYICSGIAYPPWFSWMGSLVPENIRGEYFSKRNRITGFFGVLTMIVGAFILDWAKKIGISHGDVMGFTLLGFGFLFALSGIFRMGSWILLKKEYEPRIKIRKKDCFSLKDFLTHCRETPFGKFSLFAGAFTFVVGISGPYWTVYMLRDLNLSYIWYMAITVATIIFQLIFLPLLGKFSDRFGNIKLMRMSSLIVGLFPFIWIASILVHGDLWVKIYLLIIPSIIGGFGWAGYNLALNNYVYDAVKNRKRGFGLSYMNLIISVGGFAGAGVGAIIAWMNISFINPMLFIFAISGVGRLIVAIYGSKFLHEVRNVRKLSPEFWAREITPMQSAIREVHHLEHIAEEVEHYILPNEKEEFEKRK